MGMGDIIVTVVPVFSSLCNLPFALRRAVAVVEQRAPAAEEFDEYDLTATHWIAIGEGEVCGTLRLIGKPEHTKLGRIAVRHDSHRKGVTRRMITAAMDERRAARQDRFQLDAQADKLAMYEKVGFVAYGNEFDDGGIPHRAM
ncbi:MAG: GNAT family N-acetyltransferase [Methylobacterium mesophilicum]|nr:GNAT family N-acetyltransferase [Methylobacterium mesophilicum]